MGGIGWSAAALTLESASSLARRLAPGASVVRIDRLAGGQSCLTDEVELEHNGRRWSVVVRRHRSVDDHDLARQEFERLVELDHQCVPAPEPLLFDEGELTGLPALVVSRLVGRPDVDPADPAAWAAEMGLMLARIHGLDAGAFRGLTTASARLPDVWMPPVLQHPLGQVAWDRLRDAPPAATAPVVIHGDFQSTNVLWSGGRISGVLDWIMLCRGSAGIDVGESRIDTMLLFGPDVADAFLRSYETESGSRITDIELWDLRAAMVLGMVVPIESWLARYRELGRTDLLLGLLHERLDAWIHRALDAIGRDSSASVVEDNQLALFGDETS